MHGKSPRSRARIRAATSSKAADSSWKRTTSMPIDAGSSRRRRRRGALPLRCVAGRLFAFAHHFKHPPPWAPGLPLPGSRSSKTPQSGERRPASGGAPTVDARRHSQGATGGVPVSGTTSRSVGCSSSISVSPSAPACTSTESSCPGGSVLRGNPVRTGMPKPRARMTPGESSGRLSRRCRSPCSRWPILARGSYGRGLAVVVAGCRTGCPLADRAVPLLLFHSDDGRADESGGFAGVGRGRDPVVESQLSASRDRVGGVVGVAEGILVVLSTSLLQPPTT